MYGFPHDLDLSAAIGQETTQFCIGPYDLRFSFGPVTFAVQSRVELHRQGSLIAEWKAGEWPQADFYTAFSSPVLAVQVVDEHRLCIRLDGELELHILDTSDQYESLQIYVQDLQGPHII